MAFAETELTHSFDTNDGFAVKITVSRSSGSKVIFDGIFDNNTSEVLGVESSGPMLTCETTSLGGIKEGDAVEVQGESGTFTIRDFNHDAGVSNVYLNKSIS